MELIDDEPRVSLCIECARHESLKRSINLKHVIGLCGRCGTQDAKVRDPDDAEPMVMTFRALVRFHYDEHEYNPHWGGADSAMELLADPENQILEPYQSRDYSDDLTALLLDDDPYPDVDKGISIYAGFDGSTRLLQFAISKTVPRPLIELAIRLRSENFHQVEPALLAMLEPFLAKITKELPADELWYRARLGQKEVFRVPNEWEMDIVRQPWLGPEIGAPPPPVAGMGRLNRAGVSVLYLAADLYTAVAEIRPHPSHTVSIGAFRSNALVRLADFNPDIGEFSLNENTLDEYALIRALDRLMSTPVVPDDRSPYLLTQLLADALLRSGFDGVRYRSSLSGSSNICVFNPSLFSPVEEHAQVMRVNEVSYKIEATHTVIEPTHEHQIFRGRG